MFKELNRDSLKIIASLLPNLDRLHLAETCREGRQLVHDVGLRGVFASEMRSLCRPTRLDAEQQDRLDGLKEFHGFASGLEGELGKASRKWELTEPQYIRAKNAFLTRDAPDAIQKLAEVYPAEICDLGHLEKKHGSSLRDWLNSGAHEDRSVWAKTNMIILFLAFAFGLTAMHQWESWLGFGRTLGRPTVRMDTTISRAGIASYIKHLFAGRSVAPTNRIPHGVATRPVHQQTVHSMARRRDFKLRRRNANVAESYAKLSCNR